MVVIISEEYYSIVSSFSVDVTCPRIYKCDNFYMYLYFNFLILVSKEDNIDMDTMPREISKKNKFSPVAISNGNIPSGGKNI